jgi:hypothetical protein
MSANDPKRTWKLRLSLWRLGRPTARTSRRAGDEGVTYGQVVARQIEVELGPTVARAPDPIDDLLP